MWNNLSCQICKATGSFPNIGSHFFLTLSVITCTLMTISTFSTLNLSALGIWCTVFSSSSSSITGFVLTSNFTGKGESIPAKKSAMGHIMTVILFDHFQKNAAQLRACVFPCVCVCISCVCVCVGGGGGGGHVYMCMCVCLVREGSRVVTSTSRPLSSYSDYQTSFHELLSAPYRHHITLKNNQHDHCITTWSARQRWTPEASADNGRTSGTRCTAGRSQHLGSEPDVSVLLLSADCLHVAPVHGSIERTM